MSSNEGHEMATKDTQKVTVENDGWTTVVDESPTQIKFDTLGDVFTGIKTGQKTLQSAKEKEDFTIYLFRAQGMSEAGIDDGEVCSVTESFKLRELADIPDGTMTRITYVKDVEIGRQQPMKDYTIQTRA